MRLIRCVVAAAWACQLLCAATPLQAAEQLPIIDMQHTSWTARDGAPTGITAIAQTRDGWLWIGSSVGLFRFDGVRFERMTGQQAPLSASIVDLGLLPNGSLWIAYKYGGVSLMTATGMRHYRVGEAGVTGGTVAGLGQDADGRLWLGGPQGLSVLAADGSWRPPDVRLAAPRGPVAAMLLDRGGVFWVRTGAAVYALPRQAARFAQRQVVRGAGKLAQHPDGSVWTSDQMSAGLHLVAGVPGTNARAWAIPEPFANFQFDVAGNLWQPDNSGVTRVSAVGAQRLRKTGVEQGLSGIRGFCVFQDREQNIWVGTENGLDRFRAYRFSVLDLPRYLGPARALAVHGGGGVWVDRSFIGAAGAVPKPIAPPPSAVDLTLTLHAAPDGVLWSGGFGGLWRITAGRRVAVALPPAAADPATLLIPSMATDETGALWLSMGRRGLYTLRHGVWLENGGFPGLAGLLPAVIASDARRRTWFGATNDRLVLLERGSLRRYGRAQGLHLGTVLALLPTPDGAWVGGENGVAYVEGDTVTALVGRADDPFAGTTGLVFAADGTLWLNGGAGLSAIAPAELQRALRQPGYRVQFARYDYRDGVQGAASPLTPFPSVVRSSDGALWFSTQGGTYTFDPAKLLRNTLVPPVYVTALRANGQDFPLRDGLRLPPHSADLTLEFTALSLRAPERMRFRYRLEGYEQAWQETAGRRSAHYTNLAPGSYRFRVMASNDDGLWNQTGAQLAFELAPGLTQAIWFRTLCGLAGLALLWLLHRWRLARLSAQWRARLHERLGERSRIARTLHDTILQSLQGIILHLHLARTDLGQSSPVGARLDRVIDEAGRAYEEGCGQVTALRVSVAAGIEDLIAETGAGLMRDHPHTAFALQVRGQRVRLHEVVAQEVAEIAREAMRNAFRHAGAANIDVTLDYAAKALALTVRDDGTGMVGQAPAGHWGLVGMGERAARINAELCVDGQAAPGTRVVMRVAARLAYANRRRWPWRL